MNKVKIALISVSDKKNIVDFAKELESLGIKILSTGGTASLLIKNNINVTQIDNFIQFPEILDGRVKTLHPKIHAGILAKKDSSKHMQTLRNLDIDNIDLVCVNLYPFSKTIIKHDCSLQQAIENIDIGGPALIRSAGKNWQDVAVITDKDDYQNIIFELKNFNKISHRTKFYLAKKAFTHTAIYDGTISNYLTSIDNDFVDDLDYANKVPKLSIFPATLNLQYNKLQSLRYGENPHQQSSFYIPSGNMQHNNFIQIQGKELSYNNIVDMNCAWECVLSLDKVACVIVKHANPCGVSIAQDALSAYKLAVSVDKISSFGGIIAFNTLIDVQDMKFILEHNFIEVLLAPDFSNEALAIALKKPNIRIIKFPLKVGYQNFEIKQIGNEGLLAQTCDNNLLIYEKLDIVSNKQPTQKELEDLIFLFKVAKFAKSNAIVLGKNGTTYGIGSGQTSRIDSVIIAIRKANQANFSLQGACCASDAFFPFRDAPDLIAQSGITAIIHPGGSIRDKEVIASANENNIAMVTTGFRHFRH